eukprot:378293_1
MAKIKGICAVTFPHITQALINAFGNNLNCLALADSHDLDWDSSNINFANLRALQVHYPTQTGFNYILKTAINMEKICISFSSRNRTAGIGTNCKRVKESIIKLITDCKHLKYIRFADNGKLFDCILYAIGKGLFKTKKLQKQTMKIEIFIDSKTEFNPMQFISNIVNVTNRLKM